jgi:hypothetical protein
MEGSRQSRLPSTRAETTRTYALILAKLSSGSVLTALKCIASGHTSKLNSKVRARELPVAAAPEG